MIRIERRLAQPRWLAVAVPLGSLVVAVGVMTLVLLATGRPPVHTFARLLDTGFGSRTAFNDTFVSATPLSLHRALRRRRVPDAALQHRR